MTWARAVVVVVALAVAVVALWVAVVVAWNDAAKHYDAYRAEELLQAEAGAACTTACRGMSFAVKSYADGVCACDTATLITGLRNKIDGSSEK